MLDAFADDNFGSGGRRYGLLISRSTGMGLGDILRRAETSYIYSKREDTLPLCLVPTLDGQTREHSAFKQGREVVVWAGDTRLV